MTPDDPNTTASPNVTPRAKFWMTLILAMSVAIAAVIVLTEDTPSDVRRPLRPSRDAVGELASSPPMDQSVDGSKRPDDEPDMTGASVAAYGN
jgi:hypothetical protein